MSNVFNKKTDIIVGDPSHLEGFSIINDLPLLRGTQSMLLLPIFSENESIVAVLQVAGFKNPLSGQSAMFPKYFCEVFKIVRDLFQQKFFQSRTSPSFPLGISSIFQTIEENSVTSSVYSITKYFQFTIPCEFFDIFEYDDGYHYLTNLKTHEQIDQGLEFSVGKSKSELNLPYGHKEKIENKRSAYIKSVHSGRYHYIFSFGGKVGSPAFDFDDVKMISDSTPLICFVLEISKILEANEHDTIQKKNFYDYLLVIKNALSNVAKDGKNPNEVLLKIAKDMFHCKSFLIALFDGRNMHFFPSHVKKEFEKCRVGDAYNFREVIISSNEKGDIDIDFYKKLGVECSKTFAFPLRYRGKVVGAVDIIDPDCEIIEKDSHELFCNLCGVLLDIQSMIHEIGRNF